MPKPPTDEQPVAPAPAPAPPPEKGGFRLPQSIPTWMVFVLIGGGGATGAGGLAGMMGSAEHDHPEYATEADLERVQKSINERHDKTEEHLDETNKLLTDMRIALASFRPTRSPP